MTRLTVEIQINELFSIHTCEKDEDDDVDNQKLMHVDLFPLIG